MAQILIIDDDEMMCAMISQMVERVGYRADSAYTLADGMEKVLAGSYDVVFLDIRLPDGNGLSRLADIKDAHSAPDVIIITGSEDPDGAELAIKNGAWDYVQKPASIKEMTLPLLRVLQYREEKRMKKPPVLLNRDHIIGNSPRMKTCLDQLVRAAASEADVLISGETGTGKELFAQTIHANSSRSRGNFVVVDCTALPETLVESVLFGHEKGAFTGADRAREGLIKQADGGTLFLDEIGDMSLRIQDKLLGVIKEGKFEPLGSSDSVSTDVRIIAATNKNLKDLIAKGKLREDLYFKLNVIPLTIPPLRARKEDIPLLIKHFLEYFALEYAKKPKTMTPKAMSSFTNYSWPGNVSELINVIERFVIMIQDDQIKASHLPLLVELREAEFLKETEDQSLQQAELHFEREFIRKSLINHDWDVAKAAENLKIGAEELHVKIKTLGISFLG